MKIKLTNKLIVSDYTLPLIVAEISANHNGSKKRFLNHIIKAEKAGADLIKIQTYDENDIAFDLSNLKKVNLKNHYEVYKKSKTKYEWHKEAFKLAKSIKIPIFSSPFSLKAVDFLEKLNCPIYKIASLEITDHSLIYQIAKTNKPIIMSCGSANISEINNAVRIINKFHNKLIILYCRSSYPLKPNDSNLSSITYLKKKFNKNIIGYSDHTDSNDTSRIACLLGAKIIEKHFVIDNKKTLDSQFSITPLMLKKLKNEISKDYKIVGNKKPYLLNEEKVRRKYRRSIYAIKKIKIGECFTKNNIKSLRPKIGLCASNYFKILNKNSKSNYDKNSPIKTNEVN